MGPSKVPIILNAVCVPMYIAVATLYFFAGKPIFAWIWIGGSVLWFGATLLQIKAYRTRKQTARLLARWQ